MADNVIPPDRIHRRVTVQQIYDHVVGLDFLATQPYNAQTGVGLQMAPVPTDPNAALLLLVAECVAQKPHNTAPTLSELQVIVEDSDLEGSLDRWDLAAVMENWAEARGVEFEIAIMGSHKAIGLGR